MTAEILNGISDVFDEWLGLTRKNWKSSPKYKTKSACIDLSKQGGPLAVSELYPSASVAIRNAMIRLENNLNEARNQGRHATASNWEWKKSLNISPENTSSEKILEKMIAFQLGDQWVNQVPVCNGLVPEGASACRIDLVYRLMSAHYQLIELKFGKGPEDSGSDNPLFAAMEILEYGLLYLLFREHNLLGRSLGKVHEILGAKSVDLVVIAPQEWYKNGTSDKYNLAWLQGAITEGLLLYLNEHKSDFSMTFRFEEFESKFTSDLWEYARHMDTFRKSGLRQRNAIY
jgi:hypothetical protein